MPTHTTEQEATIYAREQEMNFASKGFYELCLQFLRLNRHKNIHDVREAEPARLIDLARIKADEAFQLVENSAPPFEVARACASGANYFFLAQYAYLYQLLTDTIARDEELKAEAKGDPE